MPEETAPPEVILHTYDSGEFLERLHVLFEKFFASREPEDYKELVNHCADSILEAYGGSVHDGEDAFDIIGTLNDEGGRATYKRALAIDVGKAVATRLVGETPKTMEVPPQGE